MSATTSIIGSDELDRTPFSSRTGRAPLRMVRAGWAAWCLAAALAIGALLGATLYLGLEPSQAWRRAVSSDRDPSARAIMAGMPEAGRVPLVAPLELRPLAPASALEMNAAIPFSSAPNPPARPFILRGTLEQVARATDCMAAAVIYEAGDDAVGERAVAQVVVNRVRHPSFPKTICGVVFQGSERPTGCQFSFTCDGSMARRRPTPAAWTRAQAIARQSLSGSVFARVGYATHYHTDWVVPYWSGSLDKLAAVGTHLFFRWPGWWGTAPAFYAQPSAAEPMVPALADLSVVHRAIDPAMPTAMGIALDEQPQPIEVDPLAGLSFPPSASDENIFVVVVPPNLSRDRYPDLGAKACGTRSRCLVMGWLDAGKAPASLPPSVQQFQAMEYQYVRDPSLVTPRSRWNCSLAGRGNAQECLARRANASPAPLRPIMTQPVPGLPGS